MIDLVEFKMKNSLSSIEESVVFALSVATGLYDLALSREVCGSRSNLQIGGAKFRSSSSLGSKQIFFPLGDSREPSCRIGRIRHGDKSQPTSATSDQSIGIKQQNTRRIRKHGAKKTN